MSKFEEMKLLALCAAADNRDAFSRLVELHQEALRRFLLNLTGGNASLVDDLAQETFLKAWIGVRSFKGLSGFRTWLFRIAVNEFVSNRRKQVPEPLGEEWPQYVADTAVGGGQQQADASMDVAAALRVLQPDERMVVLLFYLEDMPIKKICKITGMPEGTVKSHLSRGRNHLAGFLKNN